MQKTPTENAFVFNNCPIPLNASFSRLICAMTRQKSCRQQYKNSEILLVTLSNAKRSMNDGEWMLKNVKNMAKRIE